MLIDNKISYSKDNYELNIESDGSFIINKALQISMEEENKLYVTYDESETHGWTNSGDIGANPFYLPLIIEFMNNGNTELCQKLDTLKSNWDKR